MVWVSTICLVVQDFATPHLHHVKSISSPFFFSGACAVYLISVHIRSQEHLTVHELWNLILAAIMMALVIGNRVQLRWSIIISGSKVVLWNSGGMLLASPIFTHPG